MNHEALLQTLRAQLADRNAAVTVSPEEAAHALAEAADAARDSAAGDPLLASLTWLTIPVDWRKDLRGWKHQFGNALMTVPRPAETTTPSGRIAELERTLALVREERDALHRAVPDQQDLSARRRALEEQAAQLERQSQSLLEKLAAVPPLPPGA